MVIHRDRESTLRAILTNDPSIQEFVDLARLGKGGSRRQRLLRAQLFLNNLVTQLDAFVTDVCAGATDELTHLLLTLPTERALEQFRAISQTSHETSSKLNVFRSVEYAFALTTK